MDQQQMPQPPQSPEGGGAEALVKGIHSDLMKLGELLGQAAPGAAEKLGQVVQAFEAVVAELLGGGGGGEPQQKGPSAGGPGSVPAM